MPAVLQCLLRQLDKSPGTGGPLVGPNPDRGCPQEGGVIMWMPALGAWPWAICVYGLQHEVRDFAEKSRRDFAKSRLSPELVKVRQLLVVPGVFGVPNSRFMSRFRLISVRGSPGTHPAVRRTPPATPRPATPRPAQPAHRPPAQSIYHALYNAQNTQHDRQPHRARRRSPRKSRHAGRRPPTATVPEPSPRDDRERRPSITPKL